MGIGMVAKTLKPYPIKGGELGRNRLSVLTRVLQPTTDRLFERVGIGLGSTVIDVGCGGGHVSFALAKRVGPKGRVTGLDFDEEKIALARADAAARGISNADFVAADVTAPWSAGPVDFIYARFILTHLADPTALLSQALAALRPGGAIIVEDVDIAGYFSSPENAAVDRTFALYIELSRRRRGNPIIGRRLAFLLEEAGFREVGTTLVQPFSREGDAKDIALLTFEAIADGLVAEGLASRDEIASLAEELKAFNRRPDTIVSMPRVFQSWGRK
jgi:ubiquinone/menaquinone biosynthesis C-methylase UbiE